MANGTGQGIEKRRITLGFVPLTDCAPLVVAREKGIFERHGLDVELSREGSWATVRDKIAVEALDAGQMLAAMPLAATLGLGGFRTPMVVCMNLNLNGNAVTMSTGLWSELEAQVEGPILGPRATGEALRKAIAARAATRPAEAALRGHLPVLEPQLPAALLAGVGRASIPTMTCASSIVPPPRMVEHMLDGAIDGYCVGAPWGQRAVDLGVARVVMSTYDIWNNHPEKVLGTTRGWAERHPNTLQALVMALLEACRWLDEPGNRTDAARLIATPAYVDAPVELVAATLNGRMLTAPGAPLRILPDFHVFHRYAAAFPWRSHALWTLAQMRRWGQLDASCDLAATADAVYRPDIYRAAASRLGIATPTLDFKTGGTHAGTHILAEGDSAIELGPDLFLRRRHFRAHRRFREIRRARGNPHPEGDRPMKEQDHPYQWRLAPHPAARHGRDGRPLRRRTRGLPGRRLRARCGTRNQESRPRLHRAHRFGAAHHRQGTGPVRQVRRARRRGLQAGFVGRPRATTSCWARKATASTARTSCVRSCSSSRPAR